MSNSKIFERLGVYGLEPAKEDALLASMLTGDPSLLIGKQGTAKTALIESLGAAFSEYSKREANKLPDPTTGKLFRYHIYDASKINFEDLVGFPHPGAMQRGEMEFIKSPMTAWDKDLICFDEFNRQEAARQNNIFELIRSRRLMGVPTGTIWIFNCMNPYGMAGTEELDEALVDRHQFFVHVTNFTKLSAGDQERIVSHSGNSDGVGLKFWSGKADKFDVKDGMLNGKYVVNDLIADVGEDLTNLLKRASVHYTDLEAKSGENYGIFVAKYWNSLSSEMEGKDWKVELSGRRAGMARRALLSFRAIDLAKADIDSRHRVRDLRDSFKAVLSMAIPIGISASASKDLNTAAVASITSNVDMYASFFSETHDSDAKSARSSIDAVYEMLTTTDIGRKIELLTGKDADELAKNTIWQKILKGLEAKTPAGQPSNLRDMITVGIVSHLMTVKPELVPSNMQALIATHSIRIMKLDNLVDSITITGQMSFYSKKIQTFIDGCKNVFVKLQAKYMFEQACFENQNSDISEHRYGQIQEDIRQRCASLERVLSENKINPDVKVTKEVAELV